MNNSNTPKDGDAPVSTQTPTTAPQAEAAKLGQEKREEVTRTGGEFDMTELHLAAKNNDLARTKQLIDWGAEVQAEDSYWETPLHYAARFNHPEVAKLLLGNGAEVQVHDYSDVTPLHIAAKYHNLEVAQWLLDNGAELQAETNDRQTPMHYALEHDWPDANELLLDNDPAAKTLIFRTDGHDLIWREGKDRDIHHIIIRKNHWIKRYWRAINTILARFVNWCVSPWV